MLINRQLLLSWLYHNLNTTYSYLHSEMFTIHAEFTGNSSVIYGNEMLHLELKVLANFVNPVHYLDGLQKLLYHSY